MERVTMFRFIAVLLLCCSALHAQIDCREIAERFARAGDLSYLRQESARQQIEEFVASGKLPEGALKEQRKRLLSLNQSLGTDVLAFVSMADLRARSARVAERLKSSTLDSPERFYDIVTIGMGPAETIGALTLNAIGSQARHLSIEPSHTVAPTFSWSGGVFSINSSNRADIYGQDVGPGSGNLNRIPNAPIQLPDLDAQNWPPAFRLGQTFQINRATVPGDPLFGHQVISVQKSNSPTKPKYEVRLRELESVRELSVFSDHVVFTGLGTPSIRSYDLNTLKSIAREWKVPLGEGDDRVSLQAKLKQSLEERAQREVPFPSAAPLPKVLTFTDFVRHAAHAKYPLGPFAGKRIAVIGFKDSGKVVTQFLDRIADASAYGDSSAQQGASAKIFAIGATAKDCEEYISNNRVRYALLAGGIKSRRIEPINARLESIDSDGDQRRLRLRTADGSEQVIDADFIILTTGFATSAPEILKPLGSAQAGIEGLPLVFENVPGRGQRPVARQVPGEEVWITGAGAELPIAGDNIAGVSDNSVSLFINGPRVATFYANRLPEISRYPLNPQQAKQAPPASATSVTRNIRPFGEFPVTKTITPEDVIKFEIGMVRLVHALPYPASATRFALSLASDPTSGELLLRSDSSLDASLMRKALEGVDRDTLHFLTRTLPYLREIQMQGSLTSTPEGINARNLGRDWIRYVRRDQ